MKHRALILLLLGLVVVIVLVNLRGTDWRGGRSIQIGHRALPAAAPGAVEPLVFLLDRQWELTAVTVFRESELRTNKYPLGVWELVADKASAPLTHLHYGAEIPGMKARYPGVGAEKLSPGTAYRIVLQAGKVRGERTFELPAVAPRR
jgi:hypothetical protein